MSDYEYEVEMHHICKSFSGVKALQDVDFCVRPGEIHALMGENGAGKSTLILSLRRGAGRQRRDQAQGQTRTYF